MRILLAALLFSTSAACSSKGTFLVVTAAGATSGGVVGNEIGDGGGLVVGAVVGLALGALIGATMALNQDRNRCFATDPDPYKNC